jgi:hypothetical protein
MLQASNGVMTRSGKIEALTELLAGKLGTAAKLRLWVVGFAPNPNSTEADFEANEASFTGYAAVTLTWSAIGIDAANNAAAVSNRAFFQATDAVTPNRIAGAWIDVTTAPGPPAIDIAPDYYPFDNPVEMGAALDFVAVTITKQQPNEAGFAVVES